MNDVLILFYACRDPWASPFLRLARHCSVCSGQTGRHVSA